MKINKPSAVLAYAGWASVFIEGWLLLLRTIPADGLTWTFFGLFFFLAVMASAVSTGRQTRKDGIISPDDLIINVDGTIHTQANGGLSIGPERPDGKMIVIVQRKKEPA